MLGDVPTTQELAFIFKKQRDAGLALEAGFARAVLSEVESRSVDQIEFRVACTSLVDSGVLEPLVGEPPSLHWTDSGYELADSYSMRIDEALKRRVVAIVQEYARLPAEQREAYRLALLANVPVESRVLVRRAFPTDASQYSVNAAIVASRPSKRSFMVSRYRLEGAQRLKFQPKMDSVKERFLKELSLSPPDWAVAWVEEDETVTAVASASLPDSHPYYQARLVSVESSSAREIPTDRLDFLMGEVFLLGLQASAKAGGWNKERLGQVFYDFSARTRRRAEGVTFTEYPTMRVELLRLDASAGGRPASHLALVADPGWHQFVTVYDWTDSGLPVNALTEASTQFEEDGAFQILPELEPCSLRNPLEAGQVKRPDQKLDVELKYGGKTRSVPADRIALRRDSLDFALEGPASRPKTALEPPKRLGRARAWLKEIVPSKLEMKGFEFKVIHSDPELSRFAPGAEGNRAWQLNPPRLQFYSPRQRGIGSTDPRALFTFGPFSGPRTVRLIGCLLPSDLDRERALQFIGKLGDAYASAGLGTLESGRCALLYYGGSNVEETQAGLRSLPVLGSSPEVVLIIGRDGVGATYGHGKDLVAGIAYRPSQFCYLSTAVKVADGSYPTAKGLALQTYLKTLGRGETPWQLGETVSKKRTLFVGIGYSRRLETGEEVSSHASLSLSEGVGITWKALGFSMRPRRYFDPALAESFIRFLEVEAAHYPGLERIVVLRRGDVYPAEVNAIKSKLHSAKIDWKLDFVGLSESNIRIFRKVEPPENPEAGLLFLLGENRCLLSVSALPNEEIPEGSVKLLELTRVIGSTPMSEIGREVYDQTFLCWGSPSKPPKVPLPLDLAEKVAELALLVSRPEVFDYFPL